MASVLSLAMKVTADASGLPAALTPVDKALDGLTKKAEEITAQFDQFKSASAAAGAAQEQLKSQLDQLTASLKAGDIDAKQYASAFNAIKTSADGLSGIFEDGARTTQQFATESERAQQSIGRYAKQFQAGAIDADTFGRALSSVAKVDLTSTETGRRQLQQLSAAAKTGGLDASAAANQLQALKNSGNGINFGPAVATLRSFTTVAGVAKIAAQSLGTAIKGALFGTGVGLVLGVVTDLVASFGQWVTGAEEAADSTNALADQAKAAEENAAALARAFKDTDKEVAKLTKNAEEFGYKGVNAAADFRDAIEQLQRSAQRNIIDAEQYADGVERAREEYDRVITSLSDAQKEQKRLADEAKRTADENKKVADSLLEQLETDRKFDGDSRRFKAAQNVLAVEQEIVRVEEQLAQAKAEGDVSAQKAAARRLADLDQVQSRERDIADGIAKADDDRQKKLLANFQEIEAAQKKAIEAAADLERERIEELRDLRLGAIEIADLRTGAGASQFLDIASGRQDPAIDEYRKQRRELEKLNKNVEALKSQRVEILKGTG